MQVFRKYDLSALPVVDAGGRLVGHITGDDIMDVANEEADEDIYRMAGTDLRRSSRPARRFGRRGFG